MRLREIPPQQSFDITDRSSRNFFMTRRGSAASSLDIFCVSAYIFMQCMYPHIYKCSKKIAEILFFSNLSLIYHDVFEKHHKIGNLSVNKQQNSTHFEMN